MTPPVRKAMNFANNYADFKSLHGIAYSSYSAFEQGGTSGLTNSSKKAHILYVHFLLGECLFGEHIKVSEISNFEKLFEDARNYIKLKENSC